MTLSKRTYWIVGLLAAIGMVAGVGATIAGGSSGPGGVPGQIDDGAELLGQATISLEEAIAAAQAAYSGALGEVDLEKYKGRLVFNVDVGPTDVKVDAADGTVLGDESDDSGDQEDD